MEHSHRFFRNTACRYFPCHQVDDDAEFNCLFCYCPLYFLDHCGGTPRRAPEGVKDCTPCTLPHGPDGYDRVIARLKQEFEARRKDRRDPDGGR